MARHVLPANGQRHEIEGDARGRSTPKAHMKGMKVIEGNPQCFNPDQLTQ